MKTNKVSKSLNHHSRYQSELQRYAYWITGIFLAGFLFIAPFFRALFNGGSRYNLQGYIFNQPIYTAMILTFLFAMIFGLFLIARSNRSAFHGASIPIFLMLLIPYSYILTLFVSAVSVTYTLHAIVIHGMYAVFFIMAIFMNRSPKGVFHLTTAIITAGYVIVIFGLLNWFVGPFYNDAVSLEPGRLRLTSVFQYANTYAAFLIALTLASIYLLVRSQHRVIQILAALMTVPALISLLLTYSRAGLVMLPVAAFVLLFLLQFRQQILYIIYIMIAGILSVVVTPYLSSVGMKQFEEFNAGSFMLGFAVVIFVSLVFAGLAHVINHHVKPWLEIKADGFNQKPLSRFIIPIAGVIAGAIAAFLLLQTSLVKLLPETIQHRISNISLDQHSVLERATFYRDSMKIINDYPLFGAGGNGWSILYQKYQNNPYTSTQAHSYFIQHWLETGLVGFIVLCVFLIYVYWRYLRYYFRHESDERTVYSVIFFIFTIAILLHSIIDFNMTYVYIGCLVFLSLGAMVGISNSDHNKVQPNSRTEAVRKWISPSLAFIGSLILFITSIQFSLASNKYVSALKLASGGDLNVIVQKLDQAINHFEHADYLAFKSRLMLDLYLQTDENQFADEFESTTQRLLDREPFHQLAHDNLFRYLVYKGQYHEAISVLEDLIDISPWNINHYDSMISLQIELANAADSDEESDQYLIQALQYYERIINQIEKLKQLPENQLPGRDFAVTPHIALQVSLIYMYQGEYEQASQLLYNHLDQASEEEYPLLMRTYLASLIIQNALDEQLYQSFIEAYPDQVEQIDLLVETYSIR